MSEQRIDPIGNGVTWCLRCGQEKHPEGEICPKVKEEGQVPPTQRRWFLSFMVRRIARQIRYVSSWEPEHAVVDEHPLIWLRDLHQSNGPGEDREEWDEYKLVGWKEITEEVPAEIAEWWSDNWS